MNWNRGNLVRVVAVAALVGLACDGENEGECGDGILDIVEDCDDGNTTNGDGCSDACAEEDGWDCDTSVEPSECEPPPIITVTGSASLHPLAVRLTGGAETTIEGADLLVGIVNNALGDAGSAPLDTTGCGTPTTPTAIGNPCPFAIDGIDLDQVTIGLMGWTDDADGEVTDDYVLISTGLAPAGFETGLAYGDTYEALPVVSAFTHTAAAQLAARLGEADGEVWGPGEVTCRGFLIGMFLDDSLVPAAGATVDLGQGVAADVYYLDTVAGASDATQMFTGASTDAVAGLWVAVAQLPAADANGACDPGDTQVLYGTLTGSNDTHTWSNNWVMGPGAGSVYFLPGVATR
jgi:cysteine-rich repeat protein